MCLYVRRIIVRTRNGSCFLNSLGVCYSTIRDDFTKYTPISKNVVGENGEWQLSNGNCTTERNCGFHTWYAKTMSSSRSAKLLERA